jgi:hypothetical protein
MDNDALRRLLDNCAMGANGVIAFDGANAAAAEVEVNQVRTTQVD